MLLSASTDVTIHPEELAFEESSARIDDLSDDQSREPIPLSAAHVIFLGLVWMAVFMTVYSGLSWVLYFHRRQY